MASQPISGRLPSIQIEYDSRGERVTKQFQDAFAARRFYASKLKSGHNPSVKKYQ